MRWLRFITEPPATPAGVEKAHRTPTTGVYYDTEWAHGSAARFVRTVGVYGFMKPAIRLFGSPKVIGADRLTNIDGPVIFAANHHSHADTSLLLATIPTHLRQDLVIAAGADYFFPNRLAATVSALFIGAIPIERNRLSKLSIANALKTLEKGRNLLIFPEGGRSPDGWGREHRPGAAFVSKRTGAPVIPVYIEGTGRILPKGKNWPTRSPCAVVFGPPLGIDNDEDARTFAKRIEGRIGELADEFSHGWWESRRRAHRDQTAVITGPEAGAWRRKWALGSKKRNQPSPPGSQRWPKL
ncbi:MAG: 1-acyl-sn-glycerol-3-phosphate acyltransferase [Actinomycetia bacterium]|nr:1-acyl-sn-glycerol-3-phosphate acyltransferase [Actinomycetes bacterium]MCP5030403.1 1-acyl-sn-glycerol-3-phosphate acyltransferase [Actinomycetes bacterium]